MADEPREVPTPTEDLSSPPDATRSLDAPQANAVDSPAGEAAAENADAVAGSQATGSQATGSQATDSQETESKPRVRRIQIGTQRPGTVAPKAKPLPLPPMVVKSKEREDEVRRKIAQADEDSKSNTAASSAEVASAEVASAEVASAEVASAEVASAEVASAEVESPPAAAEPGPPKEKVALPNLRDPSDELDKEIEEVFGEMSLEDIAAVETPLSAAEQLEPRSQRQGRIVAIHNDDVFVDFGQRQQGVLSLQRLPEPPKIGDEIDVVLGSFDAEEGLYQCVLPGAPIKVEDWSQLAEGDMIEVNVTGHNKGGLECKVHNIRGFIPAGQISLYRVEDFSEFVNQKFTCIVIEANERKKNLILSRKAVLEREREEAREKLLAELKPGQIHEGVVRKLMDFGAFIDIGGVDGLLHISRMSWARVKHPSELLKEGEHVRVQIAKVDAETGKIGFSMRELMENPWEGAVGKYPPKTVVTGRVTKIMDFGAFVELEPGVEGLIHISELAHHRVFRVKDVVQEEQEVEVEVLSVDREKQRISLSMKSMIASPVVEKKEEAEEELAPRSKPKRQIPLKGGLGQSAGGDQFGLKW